MSNKERIILMIMGFTVGYVCTALLVFWVCNPELTQMQVFLNIWRAVTLRF